MVKKGKDKKLNPIAWFLFAIVIPLTIVSVLAVGILSLAGADVIGWAKEKGSHVPVISSFIKTEEEIDIQLQLEKALEEIDRQKDELTELNLEIDSLESIIDQQELDLTKLENKNRSEAALDDSLELEEGPDSLKKTAASFRKMDQEKAANIIQNLEKQTAIDVLKELSNDVRGTILEEMEPKLAADLTQRLINE